MKNKRASCGGFGLMDTVMSMLVVLISMTSVILITQQFFQQLRTLKRQATVERHIDPLKTLFQSQVAQTRYTLFSSREAAELDNRAAVVASDNSTSSSDFALRCVRRDGTGVFIIFWQGASPAGLYIEGSTTTSSTATTFNTAIPFTLIPTYFSIDASQSYIQCVVWVNDIIGDALSRSTVVGGQSLNQIQYAFDTDSSD